MSNIGRDGREAGTRAAVSAAIPAIIRAGAEYGVRDVHSFVAYYGFPVIWLVTSTDDEKAEVKRHGLLRPDVLRILGEAGVAPDLLERAGVTVESQETVDRDFEGNWYYALK